MQALLAHLCVLLSRLLGYYFKIYATISEQCDESNEKAMRFLYSFFRPIDRFGRIAITKERDASLSITETTVVALGDESRGVAEAEIIRLCYPYVSLKGNFN